VLSVPCPHLRSYMSGRVAGTGVLTRGTPLTLMDPPILVQPFDTPYRCARGWHMNGQYQRKIIFS